MNDTQLRTWKGEVIPLNEIVTLSQEDAFITMRKHGGRQEYRPGSWKHHKNGHDWGLWFL